jgi:transcriptional regulator with XRE-family HTH domain
MAGIGARLLMIRQRWRLSLREVEERGLRIARERGDLSDRAQPVDRLEHNEHELTDNKLIALAEIYSIPIDQLLRHVSGKRRVPDPRSASEPDRTTLPIEGSRKSQANTLLSDTPFPDQSPDETTLLATENGQTCTPYGRGIIGRLDLTWTPWPRRAPSFRSIRGIAQSHREKTGPMTFSAPSISSGPGRGMSAAGANWTATRAC